MIDEHHKHITDASERSVTQTVSLIIDDVRAVVRAELGFFQARLDYSFYVIKWALCFGAIAAVAFSAAAIGLVTGLIITLVPYIGAGWATLVVTFGFIIAGLISGYQARKWVRQVSFPEIEKEDNDTL
jgi:hypothetical protein